MRVAPHQSVYVATSRNNGKICHTPPCLSLACAWLFLPPTFPDFSNYFLAVGLSELLVFSVSMRAYKQVGHGWLEVMKMCFVGVENFGMSQKRLFYLADCDTSVDQLKWMKMSLRIRKNCSSMYHLVVIFAVCILNTQGIIVVIIVIKITSDGAYLYNVTLSQFFRHNKMSSQLYVS